MIEGGVGLAENGSPTGSACQTSHELHKVAGFESFLYINDNDENGHYI